MSSLPSPFRSAQSTVIRPGFLHNLAYTLQIGREAMEERLGVIVRSIEELKEKLLSFVKGDKNLKDLYLGEAKQNLTFYAADEDMSKTVEAWIGKGKYRELLNLWLKGFIFDWNRLYRQHRPQRIRATTYPFARDRYWINREFCIICPINGVMIIVFLTVLNFSVEI